MAIDIARNIVSIDNQIRLAEKRYARSNSVKLLAVSKGQPVSAIRAAIAAGQRCFGENYLQEALGKMHELAAMDLEWHFIGSVQSNKTKAIAESFSWVHSVDRLLIAQRLNEQRPATLPRLNICIEVNIEGETSKSGVSLSEVTSLAEQVSKLPRLWLRGLMVIPVPVVTFEEQRSVFHKVRQLYEELQQGYSLDTLSMGMSADLVAAIAEGSTLVRIGSAIFGERKQ